MKAFLYIFLWFSSAFLAALICNWIGRFALDLYLTLKRYLKYLKERKETEQKRANNLLNFSNYYFMENLIFENHK